MARVTVPWGAWIFQRQEEQKLRKCNNRVRWNRPEAEGSIRLVRFYGWMVCLLSCIAFRASASGANSLTAVKLLKPPVIDGSIDEDAWREVPYVEGLVDSGTGAPYADGGRFWLAYDKEFVYFAARLRESAPRSIHATEYRTNVSLTGDDFVELDLDLSGSLSAFNSFQINAQGATNIQIAGGRAAKREWVGAFLAKGRVTASGWEIEARIPWQVMDLPRGGKRDVRFNITRFVAKNQRLVSYAFVPATQTSETPKWVGVDLPRPEIDRSVKFLPYTYVGYDSTTKGVLNVGLDMKTALTDQINLVGSVNPDFRNIEKQILSIDFSRFERLAGESRPFFQEGKQYSNSQVFVSQRIAEFDAGLNAYGRISDKTSFSLISAARFGRESDAILNVTQDPNPDTSLRITATNLKQPGLNNDSYLVRYSQNIGSYNVFLRTMGSRDSLTGFGQENDAFLTYSKAGLTVTGGWDRADKGFNPRLGFVQEVDYQGASTNIDYTRTYGRGTVSDYDMNVTAISYDHADGSFYRKELATAANFTLRPGLNLALVADLADFEGSKDSLYSLQASFPRGNPYKNIGMQFDFGRQAGLNYKSITASSAYRVSKRLQLVLREQHVEYDGPNDQTILAASYDLGKDRAISGRFVQQDGKVNAYVAFQRTGNVGVEYFLILGDPNALTYRNSLILKVAFPFSVGKRGVDIGAGPTVISGPGARQ